MRRRERKLWASAETLEDLGGLMACWLEGDLKSRPGYYGPTDLDSSGLTRVCASLCRTGVVTHQSQLGGLEELDGWPGRARLFIEAFADDDAKRSLEAACRKSRLVFLAHRTPARRWFGRKPVDDVPVVEWAREAFGREVRLSVSAPIDRSYVDVIWDGISTEAYRAVLDAWQVAIVDPQWGRNDLMLSVLGEWASNTARTTGAA